MANPKETTQCQGCMQILVHIFLSLVTWPSVLASQVQSCSGSEELTFTQKEGRVQPVLSTANVFSHLVVATAQRGRDC